jgi:hypothetical protein
MGDKDLQRVTECVSDIGQRSKMNNLLAIQCRHLPHCSDRVTQKFADPYALLIPPTRFWAGIRVSFCLFQKQTFLGGSCHSNPVGRTRVEPRA